VFGGFLGNKIHGGVDLFTHQVQPPGDNRCWIQKDNGLLKTSTVIPYTKNE